MQSAEPGRLQSAINVTPLVDVVLVLLIIFMVVAPQLASGSAIDLPVTERPPDKADDGRRIVVVLERDGTVWIDADRVAGADFVRAMVEVARDGGDRAVVLEADAALTFGDVRRAMLAVEAAGFRDVGLIAERREAGGRGE